jgi:ABC-type branched-subunit amino acid transport system ATPase component
VEQAHDPAGTLSVGLQRRLGMAQALVQEQDPLLILADEPTAGLHPGG